MSKLDYILPILKTSDYVKDKGLLISNLKKISITLSQLNKQVQLPILSLLISTKELVGKNCEVKTLIVNSILDCIRLAFPEFPRYFCTYESEISKVQNYNKATMKIKENKLYEHVVIGVIEQLDFLYKCLVNEISLHSKDDLVLSRYKYTLDRIYNNNQLLFFLFDGLVSNDVKKKLIILIFTKCMDLIGTMKDSNEIAIMAKWVVISILQYSNDSTGKREMILLIMKDLSRNIIEKLSNMDNSASEDALSIISDILNNLGPSSISFYTNNILQQVIIYINTDKYRNQNIKKKLSNKDSIYWWRSEEYTKIPEIIKYIKDYKSDVDVKLVVYEIISILHNIDTEFVQSIFSFIISDLDNINNKERLNNSKYIGKLILSYLVNSNNSVLRKRGIIDENYSISKLLDIWLTCIDDKCLDISQNIFSIIYEVMKVYFNSQRLVSVSLNKDIICKMVQVCIDNVGNPHIIIRKIIIDIFSSILTCSNNYCILSKAKICEIKHYCLQRLCDNDRDVRFQCIKCMKIYKDEPNLINNLWYAWLISVKQDDFILRQIIENILLTSSATLLFMDKFLCNIEDLNEWNYKDNEIKDNEKDSKSEVAHKIAIFFFQQRFKALSYFRQYLILRYATIYHQNYLPKNILNILENNISIILEKFSMFIFHCMEIQTQIKKIDIKQMLQDKARELIKNLDKVLKNINLEDQNKNNHYIWYKLSIISGLSSCIEIQISEDLLSCKSGMLKVDFLQDYYNMSTLADKQFESESLSRLFMFTSPIYPYFSDYKLKYGLFKVFWLPSHFSLLENVEFHDLLQDKFEEMIRYFNTIVVMAQHCYLINAISSFINNKKKWDTIANLSDESASQEVMKIIERFTNINTIDIYKKYLDKTQNMGFESFYKLIKYIKSAFISINLDHELGLNIKYKMVSNCFGAQTFQSNICIIDIIMNNVFDNISINSDKSLALFWIYNLICSAFPYLNLKLQSPDRSKNILKILKSSEDIRDKKKNKGKKEKLMAMLQLLCIESMNLIYEESSTTKDSLYIDLDKSPMSSDLCNQDQDLTHFSGLQMLKYKKEIFLTLLRFLDQIKGKVIKKIIFKKDEIVEIFLTISIANIMLGKYFSKADDDTIMQLLDILTIISENIIYSEENTSISKSNGNKKNNIKFLEQNIVSFIIETQFPTMQRASIYTDAMIMTLSFGQFLKYLCSSENDTWQIFQKKGNIEKLLGLVSLFFEYGSKNENSKKGITNRNP
ncbi:uncharacterized protein CMU_006120 [Cryptosporidium muris RN66]|uniref:Uncharacterized protein n=1 Tax=Cryptosporidium muris (strain RN66) TaxID=441375 RepID=B6AHJ4_CRYMR|nr:uncharacterized protein CMU_006120 [Cryptosporidium muris RN66]EEA07689.1 hypothetical protein CMU_006120 [Cryptosporidium muris RN66]|eukprot:XP_002142038.1 hypothetical protein [Cryptosporidium muris RN66]